MGRFSLSILLSTFLASCATIAPYDEIKAGKFKGSVIVVWIGEGGPAGDGNFIFVPDPDDSLRFYRDISKKNAAVIEPRMMYTDGGSIPRFAQNFNGFSPWGYAPAYMIHDWLFTARQCLNDNVNRPEYEAIRNISFAESAEIMGEAIKTLVEEKMVKRDDFAGNTITTAVASVIAKDRWELKGGCRDPLVSAPDQAKAIAAITTQATPRSLPRQVPVSRAPTNRVLASGRVIRSPSAAEAQRVQPSSRIERSRGLSRVITRFSF